MNAEEEDRFIGQLLRQRKEAADELKVLQATAGSWKAKLVQVASTLAKVQQDHIADFEMCGRQIDALPDRQAQATFVDEYKAASHRYVHATRRLQQRGFDLN